MELELSIDYEADDRRRGRRPRKRKGKSKRAWRRSAHVWDFLKGYPHEITGYWSTEGHVYGLIVARPLQGRPATILGGVVYGSNAMILGAPLLCYHGTGPFMLRIILDSLRPLDNGNITAARRAAHAAWRRLTGRYAYRLPPLRVVTAQTYCAGVKA